MGVGNVITTSIKTQRMNKSNGPRPKVEQEVLHFSLKQPFSGKFPHRSCSNICIGWLLQLNDPQE